MINARVQVPTPVNEPVLSYAPGSPERRALTAQLAEQAGRQIEIPLIVGGAEVTTGDLGRCVMPHDHRHVLATFHKGNADTVRQAVDAAAAARPGWAAMPWEARASIFLKAAELLAGKYRPAVNAATMLNQSKTVIQAEIDAACELIDFLRFNVSYMPWIFEQQPASGPATWNYVEYRPLEGFVLAVTPFNFTAIAGNLPTGPAMMGNTVVWKPASTAVLAAHLLMRVFKEAGLPDGVINFVPGSGARIGEPAMNHPALGGVHFTGSTAVFQGMWKTVGANIASYRGYPRIVGGNRRQGLHLRPRLRGSGRAGGGADSRRLRVPGPEVQRGQPGLRPAEPVGPVRRRVVPPDRGDPLRRRGRSDELHGRGDRSGVLRDAHRGDRRRARRRRRRCRLRRPLRRRQGLVRRSDDHPGPRSALPDDAGRAVRPGADGVRLRRRRLRGKRSSCATPRRRTP